MSQIKSKKRVADHGEVFTAEREVKAMCDLIPQEMWNNISSTFLEPACGNGNFLVEIFARKLQRCHTAQDGLTALKSITGVDLLPDNVQESGERLYKMFVERFGESSKAKHILEEQIIQADFLEWSKQFTEDEQLNLF